MSARDRIVFAAITAAALVANFFDPAPWMMAVKPLPTLWLVYVAARTTRARFGIAIPLAVASGAVGDALLAPVLPSLFVPGAAAFAVGHVAYLVAFTRHRALRRARLWNASPLCVYALVVAGFVYRAMAARGETALFAGVAGYLALLTATAMIAVARRAPSAHIAAGMVVFVLSDSHIALNNLIFTTPCRSLIFSGMATYYLAQYLIVRGAAIEAGRAAIESGRA